MGLVSTRSAPAGGHPQDGQLVCTVSVHKPASDLTLTPAPALKDPSGFLLSLEASGLWLEEGQAVGGLLRAVGELKGDLLRAAKQIGELEAKHLGRRKDSGFS